MKIDFKHLKRQFRLMSIAQKIILIGCVGAIIFAFSPWFELTSGFGIIEETEKINGFSRFSIFGIISISFALASLFLLSREMISKRKDFLNFANNYLLMFFSLEAIFALFIAIFVFQSYFRDFSSQFRFGIFLSFISHLAIFLAAYFSFLEEKKDIARDDFKKMSQNENIDINKDQLSLGE